VTRRVWCVRHAPVAVRGVCYGQSDVALSVTHEEAAARVWKDMTTADVQVDVVWSSPWDRAYGVAACIARHAGVPHRVDPRLSELSMGRWEGRRFADIERDEPHDFARWMQAWRTEAPPGGETLDALCARVDAWIDERIAGDGEHLVLTHAGVIRAFRARFRRITYDDALAERVEHLARDGFVLDAT
jgi:alpha-ribazole phosphatase